MYKSDKLDITRVEGTSVVLETGDDYYASLQIVPIGAVTVGSGVIKLQASNNGTVFHDPSGWPSVSATDLSNGYLSPEVSVRPYRWIRAVVTTAGTSGTFEVAINTVKGF